MSSLDVTLGPTKLGAEILAQLAGERATGTLTWTTQDASCLLYFRDGRPERASYGPSMVLTERGQVVGTLRAVAVTHSGHCRFEDGDVDNAELKIDTLGEVLVGVLTDLKAMQLDGVWRARAEQKVRATPSFVRLAKAIAQVAGAAPEPPNENATLKELVENTSIEEQRAWAALLFLGGLEARGMPLMASPTPPMRSAPVQAQPTPQAESGVGKVELRAGEALATRGKTESAAKPSRRPSDPETLKLFMEVNKTFKRLETSDHWEVLGVSRESSKDDIRVRYFELAKRWHSDRFSGSGLEEETQKRAEEIFRRAEEAYRVLSDDELRDEYEYILERQSKGLPTDPKVIFEAENLFRKAQTLVRRGQAAQAEPLLREAVALNKGEPEFSVYLGYALYSAQGPSSLGEAKRLIQEGLAQNQRLDAAHEFLGRIARIEGDDATAKQEFEKALRMNPKNVEAERELRLLTMRGSKKREGKKEGLGGLLGKVLKR